MTDKPFDIGAAGYWCNKIDGSIVTIIDILPCNDIPGDDLTLVHFRCNKDLSEGAMDIDTFTEFYKAL